MTSTPPPDRSAIKAVFFKAIALPPEEREAYLTEACGADSEMRAEVASLLAAHEGGEGFLDVLPLEGAASALHAALADDADAGATRLKSGTRIGQYEVLEPLGSGGMADVYRARDTKLDRVVALKLVLESVPGRSAKVLREARAASALNHPNICTLFEAGEFEGQPYLAMEYIPGTPLSSLIPPDGFDADAVRRYGAQIADALAHAHEHGVIHRDLKAANVVVTMQGRATVLDFGVAKRVATAASVNTSTTLTDVGKITGTLAYMAPELLQGRSADARSDIWALGVLLYELATGRRPFVGTSFELTSAIIKDPPAALPSKVPSDLRAIIARCLARDPDDRFQRASDVAVALDAGKGSGGIRVPRWITRRSVAVALVAVFVALALAAFGLYRGRAVDPTTSVAVLPFAVSAGEAEIGFLAIGVPDTVISRITLVRGVRVKVALDPRGERKDPQAEGRRLGVDYVLTGTIEQIGIDIRITPQLIRVADGVDAWKGSYTLPSHDLRKLQDEPARAVVGALPVRITQEGRAQVDRLNTKNADAFAFYLRGRDKLMRNDQASNADAVDAFQAAVNHDPDYVLAHAGLAMASARKAHVFSAEEEVRRWNNRAHQAALHALQLDRQLAQTYEALAAVYRYAEFDWGEVIDNSNKALELNPGLDQPHLFRATAFMHLGLIDQAAAEAQAAMDINPGSLAEPYRIQGSAATYGGRFREAVTLLEKASTEGRQPVEWNLAYGYYNDGRVAEAEQMLRAIRPGNARNHRRAQATLAGIVAKNGQGAEATDLIKAVVDAGYMDHHVMYALGAAYAQLGKTGDAMQWLGKAKTQGFPCYPWFEHDPLLNPLRGTEAFRTFLDELRQSSETKKAQYASLPRPKP